jgi:tRNA nucleotidyltransferase (CCA-adding enzyme)
MAMDLEGNVLVDPFKGREDLAAKIIRCVGDSRKRISEDRLRAFRALRFSITKEMTIDSDLVDCIQGLRVDSFESVSKERIVDELTKMFQKDTVMTVCLLERQFPNLLGVIDKNMITLALALSLAAIATLFLNEVILNRDLRRENAALYNKANEKWVVPIKREKYPREPFE